MKPVIGPLGLRLQLLLSLNAMEAFRDSILCQRNTILAYLSYDDVIDVAQEQQRGHQNST